MMFRRWLIANLCMLRALFCACGFSEATAKPPVDFGRELAPILEQHCIRCHQPSNKKGGLSLATFADLKSNEYVVAGDPGASYLADVISAAKGEKPLMPKEGAPLTAQEVSTICDWIREGAHWPDGVVVKDRAKADQDWWSLRPLAAIEPALAGIPAEWRSNPIERRVGAFPLAQRTPIPIP